VKVDVFTEEQMRQGFRELASGTVAPTLYGLSAFGPEFCVYAYNSLTRSLDPPCIPRDTIIIDDTAPEAQWAYNLLEETGEAKLREIVDHIKAMV